MFAIPGSANRWCDGVTRREFLRIGSLGAAGLALPDLFRARAVAADTGLPPLGRAKSCILLFMGGGPPQMDTFDLKPDAPEGVRGEFPPIATSVPGTQISSLLPMLAARADRYAIIRSVSDEYNGGAHGQSVYLALTGHKNPRVNGDDIRPAAARGQMQWRLAAGNDHFRVGSSAEKNTDGAGMACFCGHGQCSAAALRARICVYAKRQKLFDDALLTAPGSFKKSVRRAPRSWDSETCVHRRAGSGRLFASRRQRFSCHWRLHPRRGRDRLFYKYSLCFRFLEPDIRQRRVAFDAAPSSEQSRDAELRLRMTALCGLQHPLKCLFVVLLDTATCPIEAREQVLRRGISRLRSRFQKLRGLLEMARAYGSGDLVARVLRPSLWNDHKQHRGRDRAKQPAHLEWLTLFHTWSRSRCLCP